MELAGKTALVTGASRGIGRAIAMELAQQGMKRIVLTARNLQSLTEVATELESLGVEAVPLALDLTQVKAVSISIARAWKDYGPIHLLVNCAGVAHQTPFLRSPISQVQAEINTNLLGLYTVTQLIGRRMANVKEGSIVNVSSLMGKVAAPTMATYSATKFAIVGFTQALQAELADHNVKVSVLLPSLTDTDMVRRFALFRGMMPVSAQRVAKALVCGLRRDASEIVVGWQGRLALWGDRLAPWLIKKIVRLLSPSIETRPFYRTVAESQ
ncbi:MAG: SDR family NAD(P)-dependent oxidoreductase [Leptolyngbyaceae bacterium]|nr:SDR family NAD(P)-dependent oxidoreductase [Leptolyngbyaceae bacterium]